jgi:hypothetical protein
VTGTAGLVALGGGVLAVLLSLFLVLLELFLCSLPFFLLLVLGSVTLVAVEVFLPRWDQGGSRPMLVCKNNENETHTCRKKPT